MGILWLVRPAYLPMSVRQVRIWRHSQTSKKESKEMGQRAKMVFRYSTCALLLDPSYPFFKFPKRNAIFSLTFLY